MPEAVRGTVALLDDGSAAAADILARIDGVFPLVYRVTHRDIEPTAATVVRVNRRKLSVSTLLDTMREEGVAVGFVRHVADPVRFLADYASAAYDHLSEGFPGLMLVSCRQGIGQHRRIAVVTDIRKPITTGTLAMAGVAMAHRTGGTLDFLVLGLPPESLDAFLEDPAKYFAIKAEAEILTAASERARDIGLQPRYVALGTGKPDEELVLDAVREHGYDLVVDDLDAIDIGSRIGRLGRITRQLTGGGGGTALGLLRDAPCDVGIVVDAVNMRVIPADRISAAAGAALSFGLFAGPSTNAPSSLPVEYRMTAGAPLVPGADPSGGDRTDLEDPGDG